jgi:DNA-binding transcriptional LysR family regulator
VPFFYIVVYTRRILVYYLALFMDFEKLKTFYHIASSGSVTQAAKNLNMVHSSVSRNLSLLEEQVNCVLFERKGRGLVLTKKGHLLLDKARDILLQVEMAKTELLSDENQIGGKLRVIADHGIVSNWLSHRLHRFLDTYHNLRFEIFSSDEDLHLSLLDADAAISSPVSDPEKWLHQELLMSWELKLFASQEYLDQFGTPKTVEDLKNHKIIVFGNSKEDKKKSMNDSLSQVFDDVKRPDVIVNSVQAVLNLVQNGLGIGPLGTQAPSTKRAELIPVLHDQISKQLDICYIYPKQTSSLETILAFGKFLKETVSFFEEKSKALSLSSQVFS